MEITLCCSCLLRNAAMNLRTPYIRRDTVEIFSDMLDDCFQIQLPFGSEDKYGICEVCVSRLRDASDFRRQARRCQAELRGRLESEPQLTVEELPRGCPLQEPDEHWGCETLQEAPEVKSEMPSEEDEAADETRRNRECCSGAQSDGETFAKSIASWLAPSPVAGAARDEDSAAQEAPEVKSEMPSEEDEAADETRRNQEAPEVKSEMPSEEDEAADEMCPSPLAPSPVAGAARDEDSAAPSRVGMFGSGAVSARARQQLAMTCVVRLERLRQSQCQPCHVATDHEASLTTHMKDMHTDSAGLRAEEEACTCDTCGEHFADKMDLVAHVQTHMKIIYSCKICSLKFSCKIRYSGHSRTHKTRKIYICEICKKIFSCKSHLNRHGAVHTGRKPYSCDICNKCFSQKGHLIRHIRSHTGQKPYKCDVCNKFFTQKAHLVYHNRIHTGQNLYKCDICNKFCTQKGHLINHIRIHTGQKPYKCEICNKQFIQSSSMNTHMRIHTGQKPYKCKICNKLFTKNDTLTQHTRIHTGQKPYKCEICNKRFSRSDALKIHFRIHTGQKPYKCEVCNKQFAYKPTLKTHMRVHAGHKP